MQVDNIDYCLWKAVVVEVLDGLQLSLKVRQQQLQSLLHQLIQAKCFVSLRITRIDYCSAWHYCYYQFGKIMEYFHF